MFELTGRKWEGEEGTPNTATFSFTPSAPPMPQSVGGRLG